MPRFSVVIPTRERPDTLAHALRTAVEQTFDDVEILVHESGDDARVTDVVARYGDRRTRLVKTGSPVSMPENWERALTCAAGEYVTFIGDDDGLLPDACAVADQVLRRQSADILSWRPAAYYWPQYLFSHLQNRLQAFLTEIDIVEVKSSRTMLALFYQFRTDYSRLPMIYNSFVGRKLLGRIQARLGRYFLGGSPDISSGILNAFFCDTFLFSHRPLSVSGLSHHSTGHRFYFSNDSTLQKTAEASAALDLRVHPTLVSSQYFRLAIGNEMLSVKEAVFPNEEPSFSHRNLVHAALQGLESGPPNPEAALADIREVARKNGIAIDDSDIPAVCVSAASAGGLRPIDADSVLLDVDCSGVGACNVRDVSRLLHALLQPFRNPKIVVDSEALRSVPAGSPGPLHLAFCRSGNGILFLGPGWGELESWGVWTTGRRADIVIPLEGCLKRDLQLTVYGEMFVHSGCPASRADVYLGGKPAGEIAGSLTVPSVERQLLVSPEVAAGGSIHLEFRFECPRSPADYGLSSDTRKLGFGLRRIVVTA